MRYFRPFLFVLLAAAALTACVTDSDRPRVRGGMSRDDLKFYFGKPLRIETVPSGGEDWYYSFAGWSTPQFDATASRDVLDPATSSVSVTASSSTGTRESPIHLSADGYVIEPIPDGRIVRR
jgi:hypothetical protein